MISVLYVDDEPDLLELCRIFLEQTGEFRVDTAVSAQQALAELVKKQYDAVISDYLMPAMDGISLLKSIRQRHGDIPFILFTGRGREEMVIEALNNGANFYLQKGGDPNVQFIELMHKVRQAVNTRQAERDLQESEKLLTDIINFLPDATFAIDREGKVIAWNRAIEELTGIPAAGMLGKGDHEYAIPFYGERRPILIDLIFKPEEQIQEHYSGIRRENGILIAETDLPRPQGKQLTLMGKASPLYDRQGKISGAIESIRDITARKQIEVNLRTSYEEISTTEEELRDQYNKLSRNQQILKDSEAQYRILIETTGTGFVSLDEQGRILDANPEYVRLTGHTGLSEIKGKSAMEWTAPHDRKRSADAVNECLRVGYIRNFEVDYVDSTGRFTPVEINATVVNSNGSVGIVMLCRDISSRRHAEEALRQSETLYRTLADTAQDLIYIINKDDTIAYVNAFAATMMGMSRQEIIGKPRSDLFPGPEGKRQYRNLQQVFTSAMPIHVENQVHLPSHVTWQDTYLIPLKNPEGIITAVMGVSRDITTLKQAEDALRRSERQYRSIIDNMQDMLYRTDKEGKIMMISPAGAKLAGYPSAEEMIGLDLDRILYASPQERQKFLAALAGNSSVNTYPLVLRDRNGHLYHVTASSHYFYDAQGNILGIEGIIHNVTDLKKTEDALKDANRKLNLLNSSTRHDVANQLTVLQGYIQLAKMKNSDPVISDFLRKMDTATATIGRQIEFSKTYQELGVQAPGWFRLDDIFAKNKPKDILFSSSCRGAEVFADPMLEKVFENLFVNSVMHGERVSRITVRCEPAGDDLLITVEDNGVGIPLELKEDIFRKGFGKNTGFGLFLAREILAITGISIHETGRHGSGARFEIIVPKNGFRFAGDCVSRNV